MSRIPEVNPETATGVTKDLFAAVKTKMGRIPNLIKVFANSPTALNAYLQFSGTVASGTLSPKTREQISLTVGQTNSCDYCVSAHSAIGKLVGLTTEQIRDGRHGKASDPKTDAILHFSRKVVESRGHVSDADVNAVRAAGVSNEEVTEVIANVVLNIYTNYLNHIAGTEIDFPKAEALS